MPEEYSKVDSTLLSTTNPEPDEIVESPTKKINLKILIPVVLAVPVLFLIGFFVYPSLAPKPGLPPTAPPAPPPVLPPLPKPVTPPVATPPPAAIHQSFLRGSLDGTASFTAQPVAGITMSGQLSTLLQASPSGFFEVVIHSVDGKLLEPSDWFALLNAPVVDPRVLKDNFASDFTAYLYKDEAGVVWPGYVLKLKADKSPLLLRSDIAQLESAASSLQNFFSQSPGTALGGFKDKQLNSQPVRELQFSKAPAAFIYGWVNNQYLLISTSEDGWKQAAARL